MSALKFAVVLIGLISLPAQTRQASKMVSIEYHEPCTGLSDAECCEWTLRTASFRATHQQMNDASVRAVRLVCVDKKQAPTRTVCKAVALTRRFGAKDSELICTKKRVKQLCEKQSACAECAAGLRKLGYQQPHWPCRAATYVPESEPESEVVITLEENGECDEEVDGPRMVIKRRRELR